MTPALSSTPRRQGILTPPQWDHRLARGTPAPAPPGALSLEKLPPISGSPTWGTRDTQVDAGKGTYLSHSTSSLTGPHTSCPCM